MQEKNACRGYLLTDKRNRQSNSGEDQNRAVRRGSGGNSGKADEKKPGEDLYRADRENFKGGPGKREQRADEEKKPGQNEEQLARERARRRRRRQEQARRRRKRRRIIRLVRIFLCFAVAVLAIVGVLAVVGKYRRDKERAAADAAAAKAASQTMDIYPASEVLNLTFPVLTLDDATSSRTSGKSGAEDQNDTAGQNSTTDQDGAAGQDSTTNQDDTADGESGTSDGGTDASADATVTANSASETGGSVALTVTDFKNILQDLYRQNYVLTDVSGLAKSTDGTMKEGTVSVPTGKKPLTITEAGAGYISGYDVHADSLTLNPDGSLTNTYTDSSGKVQTGDVDVITCLDAFVKEHPDFSSQGARGVIGVTGQDGMFGYALEASGSQVGKLSAEAVREVEENASRYSASAGESTEDGTTDAGNLSGTGGSGTDLIQSGNSENTSRDSSGTESVSTDSADDTGNAEDAGASASEITEKQVEQNKETLDSLIKALRSEGWTLASGTFADISYAGDYELVKADADRWSEKIGSLLGNTDILVLPHGGDIGSWSGYSAGDSRYEYLKSLGFRYFMTENNQEFTWVQVGGDYLRIGMHIVTSMDVYHRVMDMQ